MSKEAIQKGIDALRGVIAWDIMRNHLVPYRVRDPIHEAIEALAALAEQPAQRTWVELTDKQKSLDNAPPQFDRSQASAWQDGVYWAEAKLKEKNT